MSQQQIRRAFIELRKIELPRFREGEIYRKQSKQG